MWTRPVVLYSYPSWSLRIGTSTKVLRVDLQQRSKWIRFGFGLRPFHCNPTLLNTLRLLLCRNLILVIIKIYASRWPIIGCNCYHSTQNLHHKQLPPLGSGHAIINLLSICIKCWNSNIYRRFPGACAGRPLTLRPRARSRMRLLSVRCAWTPGSGHDKQLQVLDTATWIWGDNTDHRTPTSLRKSICVFLPRRAGNLTGQGFIIRL